MACKVSKCGLPYEKCHTNICPGDSNSSKHLWHDAVQQPSPAAIRAEGPGKQPLGRSRGRNDSVSPSDSLPRITYTLEPHPCRRTRPVGQEAHSRDRQVCALSDVTQNGARAKLGCMIPMFSSQYRGRRCRLPDCARARVAWEGVCGLAPAKARDQIR